MKNKKRTTKKMRERETLKPVELEQKVDELLTRGVVDVIERGHLRDRMLSGEILRVKFGIDPTGPNIHIGRGSAIKKLREFQDLDHQIVLIIGDATAQIGDASDKENARRMLNSEEVASNETKYLEQIGRIIDINKAEIHHNSEWIERLTPQDWIRLASLFTLQQIAQRDNFAKRIAKNNPVGFHEGMYCLLQGFDSVNIQADVEIGGTDQLFNLLAGRKIQEHFGQQPQDIMTLQLLAGTDGRKMSTSWSNVILVNESPEEKYGKVMRIADPLIPVYLENATLIPMRRVHEIKIALEEGEGNPMDYKKELAYEIVKFYDGEEAARQAQSHFERVVQKQEPPKEMATIRVSPKLSVTELFDVLKRANLVKSKSDARRLMDQGAIHIGNSELRVDNLETLIGIPQDPEGIMVRVGKRRFMRLIGEE
jgi:tyrosyl-tRNA synthetase